MLLIDNVIVAPKNARTVFKKSENILAQKKHEAKNGQGKNNERAGKASKNGLYCVRWRTFLPSADKQKKSAAKKIFEQV